MEITNVAREPGYRSKIAVVSHADGVDPVGACVGPRGSRVRMVVSELRGEKIDIIPYNDEPARFVAKALSPARVREVLVDDDDKQATVIVPDDQLSLAIGREGQNARLAARLTGWRDRHPLRDRVRRRRSPSAATRRRRSAAAAPRSSRNGRRCPNAALPGSRYCGLPTPTRRSRGTGSRRRRRARRAEDDVAERRRGVEATPRDGRGAGRRTAAAEPAAEDAPRPRRPPPTSPTPRPAEERAA